MSKIVCDICGDTANVYDSPHYPTPISDNIVIRVYDVKTGYFNNKQWWTCRKCAQGIRHYVDTLSRKLK